MGLSASQTMYNITTQQEFGLQSQQELQNFYRLCNETKAKIGDNFTSVHKQICALLAPNMNATVEDVEKLYEQRNNTGLYQNGTTSSSRSYADEQSEIQDLKDFKNTLNKIPAYKAKKGNITAEQLIELRYLWHMSSFYPCAGKTPEEYFISQATEYLTNFRSRYENKIETEKKASVVTDKTVELNTTAGTEMQANINKTMINFKPHKFLG